MVQFLRSTTTCSSVVTLATKILTEKLKVCFWHAEITRWKSPCGTVRTISTLSNKAKLIYIRWFLRMTRTWHTVLTLSSERQLHTYMKFLSRKTLWRDVEAGVTLLFRCISSCLPLELTPALLSSHRKENNWHHTAHRVMLGVVIHHCCTQMSQRFSYHWDEAAGLGACSMLRIISCHAPSRGRSPGQDHSP